MEAENDGRWLPFADVFALANEHRRSGRWADAENLCWQVLRARPKQPEALHLLGVVAHETGQPAVAIDFIRQAIVADPNNALFHSNLCEMYRLSGQVASAVAAGRRAVAIAPDNAEALNNLGVALYDARAFEAAAQHYQRAVALDPRFVAAWSNFGNALRALHRFEEAIAAHERALALKPDYVQAIANLASAQHLLGRLDEAVATYRHALMLDPANGNARHGLGILLLLQGSFEEGWQEYEWRWQSTELPPRRFAGREWQGEALGGARLLIYTEQGFGDCLQFCRYLPLIRQHIGQASLLVPGRLRRVFAFNFPWLQIVTGADLPRIAYDRYCALLSLPRLCRTNLATIPGQTPYLQVEGEAVARWKALIGPGPGLKVGLVWAGNPKHINDPKRSLDGAALAPLLDLPGATVYSLQLGRDVPSGVTDLAPHLTDFAETAAAVSQLDLVISVDTAVAHLAGALGKPVWLLLPFVPDWRWMLDREDSPWYPTMRLFRQPVLGDWASVIERVRQALATHRGAGAEP